MLVASRAAENVAFLIPPSAAKVHVHKHIYLYLGQMCVWRSLRFSLYLSLSLFSVSLSLSSLSLYLSSLSLPGI